MIDIIGTTAVGIVIFLCAWFLMTIAVEPATSSRSAKTFLVATAIPLFVGFYHVGKFVAGKITDWGWVI